MELTNLSGETTPLIITDEIRSFLTEVAKWGHFLSIVGFVFLGLMLLIGLCFGTIMSSISGMPDMGGRSLGSSPFMFMSLFYIFISIINFFPIYYMYQFSTEMKSALRNNDQSALTSSFSYLKSQYKYIGILMIVFLVFYICMFLFSGVAMMFFKH